MTYIERQAHWRLLAAKAVHQRTRNLVRSIWRRLHIPDFEDNLPARLESLGMARTTEGAAKAELKEAHADAKRASDEGIHRWLDEGGS